MSKFLYVQITSFTILLITQAFPASSSLIGDKKSKPYLLIQKLKEAM